jgi:hypothetical protein
MNLIELNRALRQLRLGGIAAVLETRLQQAQTEPMAPIDFLSCLVSDELRRRGDRLLERRRKQAQFRDPQRTLDNFDFNFNKKMNRSLVRWCGRGCTANAVCSTRRLATVRRTGRTSFICICWLEVFAAVSLVRRGSSAFTNFDDDGSGLLRSS